MRTFFLVLLSVLPASATLSVVQSTSNWNPGTVATLVFGTAPTQGNLLLVGCGVQYGTACTVPSGWTSIVSGTGNHNIQVLKHVVGASETNSYPFTNSGYAGIAGYEVTGFRTSGGNTDVIGSPAVSGNIVSSFTSSAVTPTVIGDLALTFWVMTENSGGSATVSSGWVVDALTNGSNNNIGLSSCTALTTDTSTAITNVYAPSNHPQSYIAAVAVLVAPLVTVAIQSSVIFQ
jgi:hypothetical protein